MPKEKKRRTRAQQEEDQLEQSFRSISPSNGHEQRQSKFSNPAAISAICITVIVIAITITVGCIFLSNLEQSGTILNNVTVAGVDVGGMTQAEAIDAVLAATGETYTGQAMTVKLLDSQVQISPETSRASLNVKAAVKAAYKYGRRGFSSQRKREQETATHSGFTVDVTPYLDLDSNAIKAALSELGKKYSSHLAQSTYEITGTAPNRTLVVHLGTPEYGLDLDALYGQVLDAFNRNVFTVEGECGIIEPDPIDLEAIHKANYVAPVDACFDPDTFEIVKEICGNGLDIEAAKKLLKQSKFGTTVEIPFIEIAPEVTAEDLSALLYRDELATYTASASSSTNRNTNLRLACEAINGMILYPGDVFSYNDALGERTTARGYKTGASYSGNETVLTVGGGICQVSSCLYYCALVADLEILTRDNHGFAPSYIPLGMDATVSWGSVDFRFRNNSDYPIRIEANASGGKTTITLVGTDTKDYSIKMEYEVLATYRYDTIYKTMPANNAQGYRDGDYITTPYTGYKVKTYRCKYSKETAALISRDFEATSTYRKRDCNTN